jgi:hypothetical protein
MANYFASDPLFCPSKNRQLITDKTSASDGFPSPQILKLFNISKNIFNANKDFFNTQPDPKTRSIAFKRTLDPTCTTWIVKSIQHFFNIYFAV